MIGTIRTGKSKPKPARPGIVERARQWAATPVGCGGCGVLRSAASKVLGKPGL
jgi:hypothetical protein